MSVAAAGAPVLPAGRTSIRSRALQRIATAAAAESADVPPQAVQARLGDAGGRLTVSIATPVSLGAGTSGTIVERAAAIADAVSSCLDSLAGRSVERVHVRVSGLQQQRRRVR